MEEEEEEEDEEMEGERILSPLPFSLFLLHLPFSFLSLVISLFLIPLAR